MNVMSSVRGEPIGGAVFNREQGQGAPCVFKGCSGFFHAGFGPVGVVLCAPWGPEDLALRKSWRLLAEAVAKAGFPCLRFDYPGTGNSLGRMDAIEDVAQWRDSIGAAADFLRAYSGVKRFVFIGQSIGAALATQVAGLRSDVVGLMLVAPIVQGRAYVSALAARCGERGVAQGLSVAGFEMSPSLMASLSRLDVTRSGVGALAQVVVFDRVDRKAGAEMSEHFKRNGVAASVEPVEPYSPPHDPATALPSPPATIEQIMVALTRLFPIKAPVGVPRVPLLPATLRAESFKEEPLRFGEAGQLLGTLCQAVRPRDTAPVVILLGRGPLSRIGWGREVVAQARTLAVIGVTSLRLDARGLGESAGSDSVSRNPLDDLRQAVDALSARGCTRIALAGCGDAGCYALAAADADTRITHVVALNPRQLAISALDPLCVPTWRDLMRRPSAIGTLFSAGCRLALAEFAPAIPAAWRAALHRKGRTAEIRRLVADLSDRGVLSSLIYDVRDPGLVALHRAYGPRGANLRLPGFTVSIRRAENRDRSADWLGDAIVALADDAMPREEVGLRARTDAERHVGLQTACSV